MSENERPIVLPLPTEESVGWAWRRAQGHTNTAQGGFVNDEYEAKDKELFQAFLDDVGRRAVEAHEKGKTDENSE
jgi:hypothetical protein